MLVVYSKRQCVRVQHYLKKSAVLIRFLTCACSYGEHSLCAVVDKSVVNSSFLIIPYGKKSLIIIFILFIFFIILLYFVYFFYYYYYFLSHCPLVMYVQ